MQRARRNALVRQLPLPAFEIPRGTGFNTLCPDAHGYPESAKGALRVCEDILNRGFDSKSKGKTYLKQAIPEATLLQSPEIMKFALDPTILASVAQYLGELPILSAVKLLHSAPIQGPLSGSQLYHCDHDDEFQVKVFLHISDVDQQSGPLTVLPARASLDMRERLGYVYGGEQGHISDEKLDQEFVKKNQVELLGPAGTLALVDTAQCFHFGSRVATKERFIFYLHFVSYTSFLYHPAAPLFPRVIRRKQRCRRM